MGGTANARCAIWCAANAVSLKNASTMAESNAVIRGTYELSQSRMGKYAKDNACNGVEQIHKAGNISHDGILYLNR